MSVSLACPTMQLTTEQRVFLVNEWIRTGSLQQVAAAFRLQYPDRDVPAKSTIWKNVRKYQDEGTSLNLNKGRSGRRKSARTDDNIATVQQELDNNPHVSARRNGLGLSKSSFQRIVRRDIRWYPYKMRLRHQLLEADMPKRRQYCQWLLDRAPRFHEDLIIGDEASFFMNGKVNNHNVREYAPTRNPPPFHYDKNISREKVSAWIGLCGNGSMIGPFFFDGNLNGEGYLRLINEQIVPELDRQFVRQPDGSYERTWWVQDGAPPHRSVIVTERLSQLFNNRVIAMNHPVEWPPRSPDLTPCHFFLWGYLKSKVYTSPPQNINDLRARIIRECDALRQQEDMIRQAVQAMRSRAQTCMDRNGGHVEGHWE